MKGVMIDNGRRAKHVSNILLINLVLKRSEKNKHCEILVSCSDEERNCMQAHGTSCKLIELHESLGMHASSGLIIFVN